MAEVMWFAGRKCYSPVEKGYSGYFAWLECKVRDWGTEKDEDECEYIVQLYGPDGYWVEDPEEGPEFVTYPAKEKCFVSFEDAERLALAWVQA